MRPAAHSIDHDRIRTKLVVVQSTPFCNIDCTYCYLPNRTSKRTLSLEVAEVAFARLLTFPTIKDQVTFVWHAGEPTVLPIAYYEEMFSLLRRLGGQDLVITHALQTNGTLLNDAWCEFIKKWDVKIGLSIDGPAAFHDLHRKYRSGMGSFDRTSRGLRLLQKAGVPVHTISVLTLDNIKHPAEMLEFFTQSGVTRVCFNIEEKEGLHTQSQLVASESFPELYRKFLVTFFELAIGQESQMSVRELETGLQAIAGHQKGQVNDQAEPFVIISMDCDGNVSTFSPELLGLEHERYGSFCFGNLLKDDFDAVLQQVERSLLYADVRSGVSRCRKECEYFDFCGGGAPANKIGENNSADSTETKYCQAHRIALDAVLALVERLPKDLAAARVPARENN